LGIFSESGNFLTEGEGEGERSSMSEDGASAWHKNVSFFLTKKVKEWWWRRLKSSHFYDCVILDMTSFACWSNISAILHIGQLLSSSDCMSGPSAVPAPYHFHYVFVHFHLIWLYVSSFLFKVLIIIIILISEKWRETCPVMPSSYFWNGKIAKTLLQVLLLLFFIINIGWLNEIRDENERPTAANSWIVVIYLL